MEILTEDYLLMIEPDHIGTPSLYPVEDETTQKLQKLFNLAIPSRLLPDNPYAYKGHHVTLCGKCSDNVDWILPNGVITNSLAVYYIKHYRKVIPQGEINKINKLYEELIIKNNESIC